MAKEQLNGLTGLRFLAAFAIVWLHADMYFGWATSGHGYPLLLGVSFFFVLSGFILTHVYGSRRFTIRSFIRARLARLWPLHVACLMCVLLFIRADSQAFDGPSIMGKWPSLVMNLLLLQSWVPTTSYMFSWNSVSWSISTEMFFYAAFPLLLPLLKRSSLLVLATGVLPLVALSIAIPALNVPVEGGLFDVTRTPLLYSFPAFRLLEFCIGMVAYKVWSGLRNRMPTGFATCTAMEIAVALLVYWGNPILGRMLGYFQPSPVYSSWYANTGGCIAFALVIVIMATSNGIFGRAMRSHIMVKLGEISFAIYMTHQIVMKVIVVDYPQLGSPMFVLTAVLAAGVAGHYLIEKPAQRLLLGKSKPQSTAAPGTLAAA